MEHIPSISRIVNVANSLPFGRAKDAMNRMVSNALFSSAPCKNPWGGMPVELRLRVAGYLDVKELVILEKVSRTDRAIIGTLWKELHYEIKKIEVSGLDLRYYLRKYSNVSSSACEPQIVKDGFAKCLAKYDVVRFPLTSEDVSTSVWATLWSGVYQQCQPIKWLFDAAGKAENLKRIHVDLTWNQEGGPAGAIEERTIRIREWAMSGLSKLMNEKPQLEIFLKISGYTEGETNSLKDLLMENKRLVSLEFEPDVIDGEDLASLFAAIIANENPQIKHLKLDGNNIDLLNPAANSRDLADLLGADSSGSAQTQLETLSLSMTNSPDESILKLARALRDNSNTTLKSLDASFHSINRENLQGTSDEIRKTIADMTLPNPANMSSDVVNKKICALTEALSTPHTKLEVLVLQGVGMGNREAKLLAKALLVNETLTTLDLRGNNIGEEGIAALKKAASDNPKTRLTSLILPENPEDEVRKATMATVKELAKEHSIIFSIPDIPSFIPSFF